jgi:diguanylate cyclase (GGDEF)-like protein
MSRYCVNDGSVDETEALINKIEQLGSEIEKLEARVRALDKLANRDTLVDLPNRRSFLLRLERLIGRVGRRDTAAAMLFVDVNGLKTINDTFGHNAGDQALIEVARLLVASVRKTDFVARMHGDEFGILLDQTDEWTAWKMAVRIFETVGAAQLCVDGKFWPLGVAVGVGVIEPGDDPQSVIERADQQMYRVKLIPQSAFAPPAAAFFNAEATA